MDTRRRGAAVSCATATAGASTWLSTHSHTHAHIQTHTYTRHRRHPFRCVVVCTFRAKEASQADQPRRGKRGRCRSRTLPPLSTPRCRNARKERMTTTTTTTTATPRGTTTTTWRPRRPPPPPSLHPSVAAKPNRHEHTHRLRQSPVVRRRRNAAVGVAPHRSRKPLRLRRHWWRAARWRTLMPLSRRCSACCTVVRTATPARATTVARMTLTMWTVVAWRRPRRYPRRQRRARRQPVPVVW